MTTRTRAHLDRLNIRYEYVDLDNDSSAATWVRDHNGGKERKPTVDLAGEIFSEPSNDELDRKLRAHGMLS